MHVPFVSSNFMFIRQFISSFGSKRLFSLSSSAFKQKQFRMKPSNNLYIRYLEGSDTFQAVFYCNYEPLIIGREFNFNRKIDEPVDDFIKRIKGNLDKIVYSKSRKLNKKKSSVNNEVVESPEIQISVSVGGKCFSTARTCKELFSENNGSDIQFSILNQTYQVVVNSPWVDVLSLPTNIMVNYLVYPNKFEVFCSNKLDCQFTWFTSKDGKEPWHEVCSGFTFVPSEKDVSSFLKLSCTPINDKMTGPEKECVSTCEVGLNPGHCPFEERHAFTESKLSDSGMRVVSYNILAEVYAETDVAKTELFPYCPSHAMSLSYRKQLYLKEILGYNADIICLQEVDDKVFNYDLQHVLCGKEMDGIFCDKGGTTREGVATLFSTKKFRELNSYRIVLGEEAGSNVIFKSLWDKLKSNTAAAKSLIDRPTVLQVVVLERVSNIRDKLIIANTHLYFHPEADHIRLLQTGFCMEYIQHVITDLKNENPDDRHSLLFCGDFNSDPDCGAYQLMTTNHVPSDYKDWTANAYEPIEGMELCQPYSIKSACGTPQFTNFTQSFADCLDYIYYQTDYLNLKQVVPLPSEDVLRRHTALPSVVFPSDHLALVADFTWA